MVIGAPDASSSELYAETVTRGDPSWAGPLAGVALGLPVFHVMEPQIRNEIDSAVQKEHLELMGISLEVDKITEALDRIRKEAA